jgi:protein-S-isoprenylcysteine O-methyltransferase Ste14
MNTTGTAGQVKDKSDTTRAVVKRLVQVVVQFLIILVILFVSSGRLDWMWVWVYFGVGVAIMGINTLVLPKELVAERGEPRENVKYWDRVLTTLNIVPTLAVLIVAGLDERFGWSPELAVPIHVLGVFCMILGQGLFTWAMASNKFFSTAVRIQMDRQHVVASGGPYRYVRHPGYVGYVVSNLAMPLILGSLWALVPGVVVAYIFVVRTALEDNTLQEELEGYKEYAQQVRYRLLPGIW